ncbi:hypothetical protein Y032_0189g1193 [Ancylostoma ceylanicum]|uniref:Uncharacterized protein n=1 Tax=Ancylostoma ceylanicum TaxID=53326 RepID=A0A016SQ76_9BILA|nr:hypothetical protein Y032_0189g1193 [Ancylostoma ceylanicum]
MLFGKFILVLCVSSSLPSPEQLTAEQKAELEEKLKKVGEFNSNIMLNVDYSNGESDIVKMDSEKTSRARRQAVRHPLSKWANGVNYFFGTDAR